MRSSTRYRSPQLRETRALRAVSPFAPTNGVVHLGDNCCKHPKQVSQCLVGVLGLHTQEPLPVEEIELGGDVFVEFIAVKIKFSEKM